MLDIDYPVYYCPLHDMSSRAESAQGSASSCSAVGGCMTIQDAVVLASAQAVTRGCSSSSSSNSCASSCGAGCPNSSGFTSNQPCNSYSSRPSLWSWDTGSSVEQPTSLCLDQQHEPEAVRRHKCSPAAAGNELLSEKCGGTSSSQLLG